MSRNRPACCLAWLTSFLILAGSAAAQTGTAVVSGIVTDQTGAALPGARVTILNRGTAVSRATSSDSRGEYRIVALDPGAWDLEVQLSQFLTQTQSNIELTVGEQRRLDVKLPIAGVSQQVTVTQTAAALDTETSALNGLVNARQMRDLPLNGRDILQLTMLQAGVTQTLSAGPSPFQKGGVSKTAVNGQRPTGNSLTIDGMDANEPNLNLSPGGAAGLLLGVDAIREFRVYTSTYSAEYGRASGSLVQAVTQSGGNTFHGSFFEFVRNDALDARNYFDPPDKPIPPYSRHQFGGTFGGPIKKDRTFFFASYEGFRERLGVTATSTVPNALARRGLLPSASNPGGCTESSPSGCVSVPINPAIQPILAVIPLSNGPDFGDGTAQISSTATQPTREHYLSGRVDHRLSESHSLFARYVLDDSRADLPYLSTLVPGFPGRRTVKTQLFTVQEAWILGPNILNQMAFGLNRSDMLAHVIDQTPGVSISLSPNRPLGTIAIAGMGNIGHGIIYPFGSTSNTFQIQDNLSYTRGAHAWKVGAEVRRLQIGGPLDLFVNGQYSFSDLSGFGIPSSSSNPALEAFLQARPFVFVGTNPALSDSNRDFRQTWVNGYVQDDWRASPRLTLNLGLRYDFYSNPTEAQDRLVNIRDVAHDTAPTVGAIFGRVPKAMVSPRIGFSAIATSDQRTVVRAGFGTFRDQIWANLYANTRSLMPYYSAFFAVLPTYGNPTQAAAVLPTANSTPEFEPRFPLVLQYNTNVERQIGGHTVVTISYVGASGRNLPRMGEANPASAATGQRINPSFGSIIRYVMDARSTYNALQLGYERRQTGGLMLNANYTYAHSRDNASLANPSDAVNETGKSQNLFDSEAEWARSSFDVRHRVSLNVTYDVPFGPGHRFGSDASGLERVLEGWQLTAIAALQSNLPFTPIVGFDNAGTQSLVQSDRPDLVGDPYSGTCPNGAPVRTVTCWFNPSAFALPAPGTFGNAKRNSLDGPDYRSIDIGMLKTIGTRSAQQVQLRLEIFNLLNRANFAVPTNTAGPTGIGGNGDALYLGRDAQGRAVPAGNAARIFSTVGSSRQIQLGVRYRW